MLFAYCKPLTKKWFTKAKPPIKTNNLQKQPFEKRPNKSENR
jgi:hypothetical protein